jgi:general stress protein 26
MSSPEHKQLIWNLIKDIKFGMLVTNEEDGSSLRSRPMTLVQNQYDGTLYFYTNKHDGKAYEIKKDRDICITFSDPSAKIYVSLSGKANLTTDSALIDRYWNKFVSAWFPEGKEDPNLAMLEIKIDSGEHWKTDENMFAQLYEIAKANLTDTKPDLGEHESFGK